MNNFLNVSCNFLTTIDIHYLKRFQYDMINLITLEQMILYHPSVISLYIPRRMTHSNLVLSYFLHSGRLLVSHRLLVNSKSESYIQ